MGGLGEKASWYKKSLLKILYQNDTSLNSITICIIRFHSIQTKCLYTRPSVYVILINPKSKMGITSQSPHQSQMSVLLLQLAADATVRVPNDFEFYFIPIKNHLYQNGTKGLQRHICDIQF